MPYYSTLKRFTTLPFEDKSVIEEYVKSNKNSSFFWFNGHYSFEFGITIQNETADTSPQSDVDSEIIPGRDMPLLIDNNRYDPVKKEIIVNVDSNGKDYGLNSSIISNWLKKSKEFSELYCSWDNEHIYMSCVLDSFDTSYINDKLSEIKIPFYTIAKKIIKKSMDFIPVLTENVIFNPTQNNSSPIIKLGCLKQVDLLTLTITNEDSETQTLIIENFDRNITIDTRLEIMYDNNNNNMFHKLKTYPLPWLSPGYNTLKCKELALNKAVIAPYFEVLL